LRQSKDNQTLFAHLTADNQHILQLFDFKKLLFLSNIIKNLPFVSR